MPNKEYSVKEVALGVGVSVDMVRRWIVNGVLPARKINPLVTGKRRNSPYRVTGKDVDVLKKRLHDAYV